ncbi:MAG: hypothetical protein JSS81_23815 [Acidobacteria bacterium]|nr:hypothetical protein [Acidobacteriota bacterium]
MNDHFWTEIKLYFLAAVALAALFGVFVYSPNRPESEPAEAKNNPSRPADSAVSSSDRLQSAADALLPLFDGMAKVSVYLVDRPIVPNGTNVERGVAFTICGPDAEPSIFVKRVFYETTNSKQLVNILKHELTHAYFCRRGIAAGHDRSFREKFSAVGGFGN